MTRLTCSLILLLSLSSSVLAADGWQTELEAAFKQAGKEKKCVLVEFTGSDWCPPCIEMRKKVFSKESFISKASKDFILVELDFPNGDPDLKKKNAPYATKYKVTAFPTVVLFDENQEEFHRFVASEYNSVDTFLAHLKTSLKRKDLE